MEDLSKYNPEGSPLRQWQMRMLEIVKAIDTVCRRHKIKYWLDFGTLLGAVRHKGFIPWDDDLDVSVFKEDYHKLLFLLEKELPPQFSVMWPGNNKNFPFNFAKVVDSKSYMIPDKDEWPSRAGLTGLWVDIFPMIHGNRPIRKMVEPLYGRCYRRIHNYEVNTKNKVLAYMLYPLALCLMGFGKVCGMFISRDKYVNTYGTVGDPTQFVTRHRNWVGTTVDIEFEKTMLPVPQNYEAMLTAMYGDYMKIPPEDKRKVHIGKIEVYDL